MQMALNSRRTVRWEMGVVGEDLLGVKMVN